jgi:hypothetical protein
VLADDDLARFLPGLREDFFESFCVHNYGFRFLSVSEMVR